jgi:hypothetical protein
MEFRARFLNRLKSIRLERLAKQMFVLKLDKHQAIVYGVLSMFLYSMKAYENL